jgi:ATP-dependent DNA helicase RecQ
MMLGENAQAILDGKQAFQIHLPKPRKTKRARRETPERRLDGTETELLMRLKTLRREIAAEKGVPAYVVFPDRTLEEMVVLHPRSLDDMARVRGVGAAKLEAFGRTFLDALNG